ncbi:MAG: PAS domain S-box protein [Nitrospirae bacterium]|nr:PAS domain S-box protein [Nitrospirota bacterium]
MVYIVFGILYRHMAIDDLMKHEKNKSDAIAQSLLNSLEPQVLRILKMPAKSGDELRASSEIAEFHKDVLKQLGGLSIVKVKLYNMDGIAVFSTEASQIGEDKSQNPGVISAKQGEIANQLTRRDTFNAFEGTIEDVDIFASYIPIRFNGKMRGVFEIYDNVTSLIDKIKNRQITHGITVMLIMGVMFVFLFLVVRHADRIIKRQYAEQKTLADFLHENESKLSTITTVAADAIVMIDENGKITYWNPAAEKILGFTADEAVGKDMPLLIIPHRYREMHSKAFSRFVETGRLLKLRKTYEASALKKDGLEIPVELSISGVRVKDRCYSVGIIRDITERKGLEAQLFQSQKMEAIGVLAGGIAHDFNNILTAIIGYAGVTQMKMKEDDPLRHNIEQVIASAERAATLTHGLLAFSRKQVTNPLPVNLNDLINKEGKLLSRIIGEDIELKTAFSEEALVVLADSGQLEQVFMNLATNARDAMPDGGRLIIETDKVEIDEKYIKVHGYGKPGMYAVASVSDSGAGMDEGTRQKIFEPFFTTKESGRGTGLGLSIVYGIIKQHNGYINCYSEPGKGTTFKIYLPLTEAEVAEMKPVEPAALLKGTETILLAEDEEAVRKLAKTVLEEFGYKVIEAVDGEDAAAKFMENKDSIDLFFADVVMPKMSGKEVYEMIKKIRPGIKILLTSGYPADFIHKEEIMEKELDFIAKPLSPTALLKKVREALDKKNG